MKLVINGKEEKPGTKKKLYKDKSFKEINELLRKKQKGK